MKYSILHIQNISTLSHTWMFNPFGFQKLPPRIAKNDNKYCFEMYFSQNYQQLFISYVKKRIRKSKFSSNVVKNNNTFFRVSPLGTLYQFCLLLEFKNGLGGRHIVTCYPAQDFQKFKRPRSH